MNQSLRPPVLVHELNQVSDSPEDRMTIFQWILYGVGRCLMSLIQVFPLVWVVGIGRVLGGVIHFLDAGHRNMARKNLARYFHTTPQDPRVIQVAKEHFKRLGENYLGAIKTSVMTGEQLARHLTISGTDELAGEFNSEQSRSCIMAIGHFGNFELYVRLAPHFPHCQGIATYRGLNQPGLNRLLLSLRQKSGCWFLERRKDGERLKQILREPGYLLGLLVDQHAGRHGITVPFLGEDCSTNPAPALLALRYKCLLYTAICYRRKLGYWEIQVGRKIQTLQEDGRKRPMIDILTEMNQAFDTAVHNDPANWFWVHNRWRRNKGKARGVGTEKDTDHEGHQSEED